MAARTRLDRKARNATIIAFVVLLAGPLFLVTKYILAKLDQGSAQVVHPEDDQLVLLPDGSTMLMRHGSTGRIIAAWLKEDAKGDQTFLVGNSNFAPRSTTLTHDGWEHLAQFAHLLKAHPGVRAVVLFSPYHGQSATLQLEHKRADRIHDEALRQGVDETQIAVEREGFEAGHNAAMDEGPEVVLSNRG